MQVVSFKDAVKLVQSGDTLLIGGSGGGHAVPEKLIVALKERFLQSGTPKEITLLHPVGLGDMDSQGVGHTPTCSSASSPERWSTPPPSKRWPRRTRLKLTPCLKERSLS